MVWSSRLSRRQEVPSQPSPRPNPSKGPPGSLLGGWGEETASALDYLKPNKHSKGEVKGDVRLNMCSTF